MSGKGDRRRKSQISAEEADAKWDLVFGSEAQKQAAKIKLKELEDEKALLQGKQVLLHS